MSSKSSTSTSDSHREASAAAQLPELTKLQFARGAELMAAVFRAGQAMQHVNLQMSERAALLHSQAAENARKATSPTELLQIQSTLMFYQWQEMSRYSQEMLLACSRVASQPAAVAVGEQKPSASSSTTAPMTGLAEAAIGAAAPMVHAWQQMFAAAQPEATQARH